MKHPGSDAAAEPPFDVSVIGLGYVGLPTAAILATHGMRVAGVDPVAIFWGKSAALAVQLAVLDVILLGAAVLLYGADVPAGGLVLLVVTLVVATCGLACVGTLYGGLTAGFSGREASGRGGGAGRRGGSRNVSRGACRDGSDAARSSPSPLRGGAAATRRGWGSTRSADAGRASRRRAAAVSDSSKKLRGASPTAMSTPTCR